MTLDVFFDPQYARIFEGTDGVSKVFEFENEFGAVRHTFLVREIPTRLDGRVLYDLITPYGYGGPVILHSTDPKRLMEAFKEAFFTFCRQNGYVCEFVRFHLFDNTDVRQNYYGQTRAALKNVVVPTDRTYETVWMDYEHKVRKNVNKAKENGLRVIVERNLDHLSDFLRIYYNTMDRNEASRYFYFPRTFFEKIAEYLPNNYVYFHVLKDDIVISTELVLLSECYAYSFLGGTDKEYYAMRPNDFLKDAVIQMCIEEGKKCFVLGGGYGAEDGIYRYKRSFTKSEDVPFYVGSTVFDREAYDRLTELRMQQQDPPAADDLFFPLYRA